MCIIFIIGLPTKPLLRDLYNIVTPDYAFQWRTIGEHLEITNGVLNTINHDNHHKAEDCCNAVWEEWLNIDASATWFKVIQVIDAIIGGKASAEAMAGNKSVTLDNIICNSSDQLQEFYINERYNNTEDNWPTYQPDHFTSVALIHHKEKHYTEKEVIAVATKMHKGNFKADEISDQSTVAMRHEQPDEYFMGCKSTKDIAEIFAPPQNSHHASSKYSTTPNVILIEGAPGIGKTILSKEIAFQWANNNLLSEKLLLFLIFLRDPFIQSITCLKDFVSYALCSSPQNKNVELITEYLENTSGKYTTIVFDGYDEISEELRSNSFIGNIISRKCLKLCGLVITSRPTASAVLHSICDCRVEILGFTKEDRTKYICQSLENNPIQIKQLKTYLETNSFIDSLCYIPLNMTILICLFKENTNSILPRNQTDMNDQFVCITISRCLRKKNIELNIKSLENLPVPYNQQFKNLSRLAFDLLGKDKIVFNDNDVTHYSNWSDLGLLKIVKYSSYLKHTPVASYNFLHFSLQEFLAAYYVTSLSVFKQVSILKDKFWSSRYLNSWVMYAGLTRGNSVALKHVLAERKFVLLSLLFKPKSITNAIISDKVKRLHLFQCFLEAGDERICQLVGSSLVDEKIDLSNITLLTKDMHTLCFFLTRSTTKHWKLLDLSNCYIGDDGCDVLVNLLIGNDKGKVLISTINLSNNHLSSKSIFTILKLVQYFNIKQLILTHNNLDNEFFLEAFFANIIQQQIFHETLLSIRINETLSVYAVNCKDLEIKNYLQIYSDVYSICLWNANFKVDDLLTLLSNVIMHHSRIELNIFNEGSDSQVFKIQCEIQNAINRVKKKTNTFSLQFSYILISQTQILTYNIHSKQFIQVIKYNCKSSIVALHITGCALSDKLLCNIGNILSVTFNKLKVIHISQCGINDIHCKQFCEALFSSKSVVKHLELFDVSDNKLTNNCINTVITVLQYCAIDKLNISYNKIEENTFCYVFICVYKGITLLNSSLGIPLVVYNNAKAFNIYAEVYIAKFKSTHASVMLDFLFDNFLHRVIILECASLLINYFDKISLWPKNNVKFQIQDSMISDSVAAKFITRFSANFNLQYKIVLVANTILYVYNHKYEEIKTLLPSDNSKVKLQIKDSSVPDVAIPRILAKINFFKGVQLVDLSGCTISDSGCKELCNFFETDYTDFNAYLHELDLSNNCLTSLSTVYITRLLQLCTISKLKLYHNGIETENFSTEFFKNRYDMYCNCISKVPLMVVFSDTKNEGKIDEGSEHLNFTSYFLSTPLIEDLTSMTSNDYHDWIFLVNTNIKTIEYSGKIMEFFLAKNIKKITIIEEELKDDFVDDTINELKRLQTSKYSANGDIICISYLSLCNNVLSNDVTITKVLNLKKLEDCTSSHSFFLPSLFQCNRKQWNLIDLSHCNIGDYGCTILLEYFTSLGHTNTVNFVNFSNNNLSHHCISTIAKLVVYSKIKILFVSHNDVRESDIASAVCKLQSKSSEPRVPAIRIFKNHCVALITHNLIISSLQKLIDCKSCCVTFLSFTNCYLSNEEHTHVNLSEFELSRRALHELECNTEIHEQNKKMTHLVIKNCNITHGATILLASEVLQSSLLTHLEISYCKVQENGLYSIVSALEETTSLLVLNLSHNFISHSAADKIASIVGKNLELEDINLSECYLQEEGMTNILKCLTKLSSLKFINLSNIKYHYIVNRTNDHLCSINNQFSSFSLLPTIISNNPYLMYFNIANCKVMNKVFAEVLNSISLLKSLKHLDISGNAVTDEVADYIKFVIGSNRNMEYLNVSNCCINDHGLFTIFKALSDLNGLMHLDVSLNQVFHTAMKNIFLSKGKLMYLNFCQCSINPKEIVNIISSLKENNLTCLDLSHNQIDQDIALSLFTIIFSNQNLKHLNLKFCNLTEGSIKCFADCLTYSNLEHLNVSHNYMSRFSAEKLALAILHNKSLKDLDLSECGFVAFSIIDASLRQNSNLKSLILKSTIIFQDDLGVLLQARNSAQSSLCLMHLDLSNCDLSGLQVETIVKWLLQVSTLECLDFSYNIISNDAIGEVASSLSCNLFLEKLNVSGCELSEPQITTIVTSLSSLSRLKHLDISHNNVTDKVADKLASVLTTNPSLEHLNLSNCELSELHITGIVKAFSEKESFLIFLDISHNTITNNESDEIASVVINNPLLEHLNLANCKLSELQLIGIFKALRNTSLLKFLDISHSEVSREAANEISSVIVSNRSLQYLNLSACNLEEDSLTLISNSLAFIRSLLSFDVSFNVITDEAAKSMSVALSKNVSLEQLNFCACFVGNVAFTIFNAISHHRSLTHLNIRLNIITNDLAKLITSVLSCNVNIKHLDFEQCELQESGFIEIIYSLRSISALQYLSLEGNDITKHLVHKVTSLINKNTTLKHLNLSKCNLLTAKMQIIIKVLSKFHSIEYLNISKNKITCQDLQLNKVISNNCKMKHLNISGCKLHEHEINYVLTSLRSFKYLKSLNFQSCYFNHVSASQWLPDVIIRNKMLQYLNLNKCNLQEEGLIAIATALQVTTTLRHLSLNCNHMTNAASQKIALAVSNNCKLELLALSGCIMKDTESGLMAISQAMCKISSLKHLNLSHNNITDKAATVIASAIANNSTMQCIDFSFCTWQETGITTVHQAINKLPMIKEVDFRFHITKK